MLIKYLSILTKAENGYISAHYMKIYEKVRPKLHSKYVQTSNKEDRKSFLKSNFSLTICDPGLWILVITRGGTLGSKLTPHLVGVFVIVWCRTMHVGAELAPW